MNNKRKLENGTLEQKFSIILHDLFSFSVFLYGASSRCKLPLWRLQTWFGVLVKEQHEKEIFVDLCNPYPEAFSIFNSCSLKKNYWIEYFLLKS